MDVAIVFLPLIGAIVAGLFGRLIGAKIYAMQNNGPLQQITVASE